MSAFESSSSAGWRGTDSDTKEKLRHRKVETQKENLHIRLSHRPNH